MRKKLFTFLLAIVASISPIFAESGTCGPNLTWDLTDGVLTISGTGAMEDYTFSSFTPWDSQRITSIVINNGVTSIGKEAFGNCRSLTSVTVPNSVTSIGEYAFSFCISLTSVTIPNSVTSIGEGAFNNVPNIVYNGSAAGSPWEARSVNGFVDVFLVYADDSKTTLLACSALAQGEIVIPNSVTSIGSSAFSGCDGLISVTIPNSVKSIGYGAFRDCTSLTSVTIPNSVTSIGGSVFMGCIGLTYPVYNAHVFVYMPTFYSGVYTIPYGIESIVSYAFSGCSGLTSVTIPNSVTSIGDHAFNECRELTSVTIPNSVISIGYEAFYGCSSLTSVTIPNNVTSIGSSAFRGCSGLTSVTIPNSVTSIGSSAFSGCIGLTSVTIPNSVTSIGEGAFYNVPNIVYNGCATGSPWGARSKNGYVDDFLVYADASKTTLRVCSAAAEGDITIPNSVTSIGGSAFMGCSGLTSVTIPNSVTSIGYGAFRGCTSLTSVMIPNSVTDIGMYTFCDCTGLTSVTISNSVPGISKATFSGCSGLTSVTLPNSVKWIGESAFSGCSSLTFVTIPNSVTSIDDFAFSGCSSITAVHISDLGAWCEISFRGSSSNPLCSATHAAYLYLDNVKIEDLIIPNSVTGINSNAFYKCSGLTSVTLPNSVKWIGESAFSGCSSLTFVTIPNSVTSIDDFAFSGCSSITAVHISDLGAWCEISFRGSSSNPLCSATHAAYLYLDNVKIEDLIIPNSVTGINSNAFYKCSGLTSVTIPNSVKWIGERTFAYCTGLTSVTIPNSVTSIGNHAFYFCSGLTSVTVPNSVISIGSSAFSDCIGLTSIMIPNSVTSIGDRAFHDCSNLKYIISLPNTPPTISSSTFPTNMIVCVPNASVDSYKLATYWKNLNIKGFQSVDSSIASTSVTLDIKHNIWTLENNYISSCGIEGGEQQPGNVLEYIGLEPESEYKDVPIVLTSNTGETETVNVSFTTTALELTTKPSKAVSSTTAILLAETNMSDAEVNCGFEYKRNDAPADMDGTKVFCPVASGQMAGRLKNLKDDVYYKYRAFYQSAAGNMFYGDWQYIFTGDVAVEFDPILYTYGATVVRENEATISGYALAGSEDFTEQGFEYWAESRTNSGANAPHRVPAALNEHFFVQASGIALRATLTNLDAGTVYKYRVYGKVGDQYYYGAEQAFTTTGTYTPPTYTVTFANWDGAVLQSSQVEDGKIPVYSGETPVRPEDEQYTYTFSGWTPQIVAATADATYTAQYVAKDKHEGEATGFEDVSSSLQGGDRGRLILHNGQIFILRGEKVYSITGQEVR